MAHMIERERGERGRGNGREWTFGETASPSGPTQLREKRGRKGMVTGQGHRRGDRSEGGGVRLIGVEFVDSADPQ